VRLIIKLLLVQFIRPNLVKNAGSLAVVTFLTNQGFTVIGRILDVDLCKGSDRATSLEEEERRRT